MFLKNKKSQKGVVSIALAILILGILIMIGTGVSALMLAQIKLSTETGDSAVSIYAAEAGAERCLYQIRKDTGSGCDSGARQINDSLDNGANYNAEYSPSGSYITSVGVYKGANRKVELSW